MIQHPFRWHKSPSFYGWERGDVRVSHRFVMQADPALVATARIKHRNSILKLVRNVQAAARRRVR